MTRMGIAFLGAPSVPEMVQLAQQSEALGYDSVWVAETRFTRDAIVPAAAIAQATSTIKIGTGVVNPYTRAAVLLAISFVTLDELSDGRTIVGLGPGSPKILEAQGVDFHAPLQRTRECVEVMRAVFADRRVDFIGQHITATDVDVEIDSPRSRIPIVLGVTGPRGLELAGEHADGVVLNGFLPQSYYHRAMERLTAARARSLDPGRSFDIGAFIVTSVDRDAEVARDRVRPLIATYLATFPNIAQETDYPADGLASVRGAFDSGGAEKAGGLIDDHWVDALTVAGTAEDCQRRMDRYRYWGVDLPIAVPVANVEETVELFAPQANQMKQRRMPYENPRHQPEHKRGNDRGHRPGSQDVRPA